MSNGIEIGNVEFEDDGNNLNLRIEARSTSARTLHLYASTRGMLYDQATKTLKLFLTDQGLGGSPLGTSFVIPRFASVDPNGKTIISLKLPRFITRMLPGQGLVTPKLEKLPIHDAAVIDIEASWSDTPFYSDPRENNTTTREQLVRWSKGVARHRTGLKASTGQQGKNSGDKANQAKPDSKKQNPKK